MRQYRLKPYLLVLCGKVEWNAGRRAGSTDANNYLHARRLVCE
jgi:hypothetical protein